MTDQSDQGQAAPFTCPRCAGEFFEAQPAGWVCLRCARVVRYTEPRPGIAPPELDAADDALADRLQREYPPAGGSLKDHSLLSSPEGDAHQAEQLEDLHSMSQLLLETAAMLYVACQPPLSEAQTVGHCIAVMTKVTATLTRQAELLYPAGELGGVVFGHLGDPEAGR